ncbi:MAG: epoxide hydrolase N-terminal domain-containing protein [Dehalococcoidia bacterium]
MEDLRSRLARTRWPDEIVDSGWDYGSNLGYMKELAEYWRTEFDWRAQERVINGFRHFRTDIDGRGPIPCPLF